MPLRTTLWFYAALAAVISITSSSPAAKAPQAVTVDAILTSPWLWGRDFNGARPHLRTWTEIGEQTLDIFPSRIDGHTPIKKTADAAAAASQLSRALDRSLAAHALTPGSIRFRTTVVTSSDDDFPRVAWTDGSLEF